MNKKFPIVPTKPIDSIIFNCTSVGFSVDNQQVGNTAEVRFKCTLLKRVVDSNHFPLPFCSIPNVANIVDNALELIKAVTKWSVSIIKRMERDSISD